MTRSAAVLFGSTLMTVALIAAAPVFAATKAPDAFPRSAERDLLSSALRCEEPKLSANRIAALVYAIGGHAPVLATDRSEFTWPASLPYFGEPVDGVAVTRRPTLYGEFYSLQVRLPAESLDALAFRAQLTLDADGVYRRWVGPSELELQTENGVPVMVCTPNVNNWRVRLRRFFNETLRS